MSQISTLKMEERCFFEWRFNCGGRKQPELSNLTEKRIKTIIKCSKQYGDGIHEKIENDSHIQAHRNCTDSYCHPTNIKKATKRKQSNDQATTSQNPQKREKRSDIPNFNFRQHCLYCGEVCLTERNPKNPSRWRPAFVCRQVERPDNRSFKQETLDICDERNDKWASEVRLRIAGALSDLHAADARYHVDCRLKFRLTRYTPYADGTKKETESRDEAFEAVVETMENDQSKIWNSIDLYTMYTEYGGHAVSRRVLVTKLSEYFKDNLMTLSSPGVATILAFKSRAKDILGVIPDLEDDCDLAISWVKDKIRQETKRIKVDRSKFNIEMNLEEIMKKSSGTVLSLLAQLSPKLDSTLPAFLIANMITSVLTDCPTELQITLAVLLRDSKELVKTMNDFGVTCTYDELLRFKRSVAVEAAKKSELTAISNAEDGLVQFVADNFDADIASQNGKLSTHSLAVLMTQPETNSDRPKQHEVSRLKKNEMSKKIDYKIETMRYNGPKKPEMQPIKYQVPPLKVIAQMAVSTQRANEKDFNFLKKVIQHDNTPEFNGYNTGLCRDEGKPLQPRTKAVYLPLIDMPPAHPDTIMTAMRKAQQMTEKTGQKYTLFTVDQQLYKVVVDVKWAYPDLFQNVIPRLGGMHLLMSFVGSVGTLMADTGLAEILASTFGGVGKMMTGKKFPMNMRAMRMVAEELLRDILSAGHVKSQGELLSELENLALQSRTTKMWIQNLIKPVLVMMMYVRAEREADWALHLQAVKLMIPYFFASAHVNYARYSLLYLRSMEALPEDVLQNFWQGEHVMHHKQGIWNGIWSDMFIESTFMRYGHGKCGIIGITLKPETMKTWALSLHVCGKLLQDLSDIRENASCSTVTKHKEEYASRISADNIDRKGIRSKLDTCIHPLEPKDHPKAIVNVVNGRIAPESVNVDTAHDTGMKQMKEFEQNLPEGFYAPISKKVVLMSIGKKAINLGESKVYDTKLIYSRVIGLQASSRDLNFRDVMACELSPVPTALFDDCGDMRIAKSKATLKNQTKVEVSTRQTGRQQGELRTVIDGCALLWIPSWPSSSPTREATVADYVNKFKSKVADYLKAGDTYLIFDRYYDYSIKCTTRSSRGNDGSRVYQLNLSSPLPSQKLTLTVSENKRQLIQIISKELQTNSDFMKQSRHKLVITDQEPTPTEVRPDGSLTQRQDLSTNHEEADTIIVQQAIKLAADEASFTRVIADDTDVYILLLHHYHERGLTSRLVMESPIKDRTVIDIPETVDKLKDIIHLMLPGHALTGCDTVGACFGIGKGTLLKVLRSNPGMQLESVGDIEADMADVMHEATALIGACYGQPHATSMTEARWSTWRSKVGRPGATNMPNLSSLPPTTEAFTENAKRAHLQTWLWRKALDPNPNVPDPTNYGYTKEQKTKSLVPLTVPSQVQLAPANILKLIRCTCSSEMPCRTAGCGCHKAKLACTVFCSCSGAITCQNAQTREARDVSKGSVEGEESDE